MPMSNSEDPEMPETAEKIEGLMISLKADLEQKIQEIEQFIKLLRRLQ